MANRVVNVRLLVSSSQFNQGMLQSGASVRVLANSLGTTQQQAQAANDRLQDLSVGAVAAGGAMSAAFGYAMTTFANFDQQMSAAGAAASVTGDQLDMLRQAAIDAGSATNFSATEAAAGIEELAKAGLSAADITSGALTGALNLAAAGGIEVADAAEIAATAMTVFGMKGSDVAHIADVLTAAANKSQASVDDVAQAMNQSALVAEQTGLSFEDTAGALALFASNGLTGSDAGTSFKTMLASLNPRSKEAAALMDDLGLRAYDAAGEFIGLEAYAGRLQDGLKNLSTEQRNSALQTIFGTDAIRAAAILYGSGSEGVAQWTTAVDDTGLAAETAATRTDNLAGDLDRLKGAIESAILGSGDQANGVLRTLAQEATNVVNGAAALPGPLQEIAIGAAGISGPALAAAGALGLMYNQMATMQTTMAAGGAMSQRLATAIGFMKGGMLAAIPIIGLAVVALSIYGKQKAEAAASTKEMTDAIVADNGKLDENTRKLIASRNANNGVAEAAEKLGLSTTDVTAALTGNAAAADLVNKRLKEATDAVAKADEAAGNYGPEGDTMNASMQETKEAAGLLTDEMSKQSGEIEDGLQFWDRLTDGVNEGTAAEEAHAEMIASVTDGLRQQADAAEALRKALDSLNTTGLDVEQANIDFVSSLTALRDGMTTTVDGVDILSTSLDINSEAGLRNRQNMLDAVEAAQALAVAETNKTQSVEAGIAVYEQNIATLMAQATEQGFSQEALDQFSQSVIDMPALKEILVQAKTESAEASLQELNRYFDSLLANKTVSVSASTNVHAIPLTTVDRAAGGYVSGPGTGTSDSIPARLSNGEYVIQASAVDRYGVGFLDALNGGSQQITAADTFTSMRPASPMGGAVQGGDSSALISEMRAQTVELREAVSAAAAFTARAYSEAADRGRMSALAGSSSVNR